MLQFKGEFFSKEDQPRPDIVIDLRRRDIEEIKKWDEKQKLQVILWLEQQQRIFNAFVETIKSA